MAIDWQSMTDEEFNTEYEACQNEQQRRATLASAEKEQNDLNIRVLEAEGIQPGDPWRQPTGSHDAYYLNATVLHNGSEWVSLTGGNVWEPGVSGWREIGTDWPDWVAPTGAHDAYPAGAQVTHIESHWISDVESNVWEPGVYGWTQAP